MSQSSGLLLASNASGAAALAAQTWTGGRAALVLNAAVYPATCQLEVLAPNGTTWIKLNASAYVADQVTIYDIPAGQVRMNLASGTVAALYAALVRIPY